MKTFDEQLRAAYEAGYEAGADQEAYNARGIGPYIGAPPTFDEWRAALSGLDLLPHADLLTEAELENHAADFHILHSGGADFHILHSGGADFHILHSGVGESGPRMTVLKKL